MTSPWVTIDGDALRHNLAVVRRLAPASRVIAVIKANAYGHGLIPTARALDGADAFGVARLDEGMALRAAGITHRIVLLEGVFTATDLATAAQAQLQLVVHSFEQVRLLEVSPLAVPLEARFDVWVKVDTGMNRLGFRAEDFAAAWLRLQRCKGIGTLRVMTHLTSAEAAQLGDTPQQVACFNALTGTLNAERSIANSAGLLLWPETRCDWVRPGLMLYGISPVPGRDASLLGLRPAMTFATRLLVVRRVPKGEGVGYNARWRAAQNSLIGIAAVGYGDGYPRNMRNGAPVLVNGLETHVVGQVSMDLTAIDVTNIVDVQMGDEVILWGAGLGAERVAPFAETIAYELVCGISQRVGVQWMER